MDEEGKARTSEGGVHRVGEPRLRPLLGFAFLVGFSPALVDLGRHLCAEPWARYALAFPILLALALWRAPGGAPAPLCGGLTVAAGALVELLAVGSGFPRFARLGLALGGVGLLRLTAAAPLRVALLALWLVPVPWRLVSAASPELETAFLRGAAGLAGLLGADLELSGSRALLAAGPLAVRPSDGGLPLAALLSGLGWYAGLRRASGWAAPLGGALAGAVLVLLLQPAALAAALLVASAGAPEAARAALDHGLAPGLALAALLGLELGGARAAEARP